MKVSKYRAELDERRHNILVQEETYECANQQTTDLVVNFLNDNFHMDRLADEYVYMVAYNTKMRPLGVFELSHGTIDASCLSPRDIFVRVLLCGAYGFILVHNHPSGDPTPSRADQDMTQRIKQAGELMGIKILDHIIIGNGEHFSFASQGIL